MKKNNCLNCEHAFEGNYCPNCGQNVKTGRVSWSCIKHDIQYFFHFEETLNFTMAQLLVRPQKVIHEFLAGKHQKYFGPFSTALSAAGLYVLIYQITKIDSLSILNQMIYFLDSVIYSGKLTFPDWITDYYAFTELIIFIPIFSIASFIAFKNASLTFTEHIAANAFFSAQRILVGILTFPFLLLVQQEVLAGFINIIIGFLEGGITIWAYVMFFRKYNLIQCFLRISLMLILVFLQLAGVVSFYNFTIHHIAR